MVKDLPIKNAKPIKIGNSYYFSVPHQYIDNDAVKQNKYYDLQIGKTLLLERRRASKKAGCWVLLIDAALINEKAIKVDKLYMIILNEAEQKRRKT